MQEAIFCYGDEAHQKLADDGKCVFFWEFLSFFEEVLEVALIAELSNDVAIVGRAEDVVAFEYVRMRQFLQRIDLALKHSFLGLALDGTDVDHLYGHLLFRLIVGPAINYWAETAADDVF